MVDEKKVKQGKKSKAQGSQFELRVRVDLESKGWICAKWTNNVEIFGETKYDLDKKNEFGEWVKTETIKKSMGNLVRAKAKWAGPNRPMMMGAGFPDFIAFRQIELEVGEFLGVKIKTKPYEVIGVECKISGELDRAEKEKCKWLLEQGIFNYILIAEKTKVSNRVVIVYHDFKGKYRRFYK